MKNLKKIFVLLVLTVAFYSCDAAVTIDDPKTETIEDVSAKTGDENNETDERDDG
jgi:hypothetical protein